MGTTTIQSETAWASCEDAPDKLKGRAARALPHKTGSIRVAKGLTGGLPSRGTYPASSAPSIVDCHPRRQPLSHTPFAEHWKQLQCAAEWQRTIARGDQGPDGRWSPSQRREAAAHRHGRGSRRGKHGQISPRCEEPLGSYSVRSV